MNEDYIRFYQERRVAGDTLILDNGAYEGERDWSKVVKSIPLYKPQIVCLPDLLMDGDETWRRTRRFLADNRNKWEGVEWMYIPQGTNTVSFLDNMFRAIDEEYAIKWIGLPRVLPTKVTHDPLIRAEVCNYLRSRCPQIRVHALGMAAGNLGELKFLAEAGCQAIDSSAPVWRGWHGYSLKETSGKTVVGDVNFDAPFHGQDVIVVHDDGKNSYQRKVNIREQILANLKEVGIDATRGVSAGEGGRTLKSEVVGGSGD